MKNTIQKGYVCVIENPITKEIKHIDPKDIKVNGVPLDDDFKYFITDEELDKLSKHQLKWSSETYQADVDTYEEKENADGSVEKIKTGTETVEKVRPILVPYDNSHDLAIQNAKAELKEIHKWLCDNDWKVNKIVIGEWQQDDERWLEYLQERQVKRARQDELNEVLNDSKN